MFGPLVLVPSAAAAAAAAHDADNIDGSDGSSLGLRRARRRRLRVVSDAEPTGAGADLQRSRRDIDGA